MKCRDIEKIDLSRTEIQPIKKYKKIKPIIAFDTETIKGKAFLLGIDDGINKSIHFIEDFYDIANVISKQEYIKSYNFFYNIGFDLNAILKHLPLENIKEMAKIDKTVYEDYLIKNLPNKSFSITDKSKHTVKFFDLAQFYNMEKLNTAAIKHLGYGKEDLKEEGIDITNLSIKSYLDDPSYKYRLNSYLERDCEITQKLGVKLYGLMKPYIIPKGFYSQAFFSQQFFLENVKTKMSLPPKKILQFALSCYQGGRFEVIKRGYFDKSQIYDIKSAYPEQNALVPNICKEKWIQNKEYEPEALVSIFNVNCKTYDCVISPMKYQLNNNLLIYPNGEFKNIFLNKKEYELMDKLGYPIKINEAVHYFDKDPEYPYQFLKTFYEQKEQLKREGKKDLSWIPKILMNGFYGKSIQVNPHLKFSKEYLGNVDLMDYFQYEDAEIWAYRTYQAGHLFNPIVANEITANTRVKLYETCMHDMDKVIGFQTDSIITDEPLKINIGDKLGDWEQEKKDKPLVILGSGVYQVIDPAEPKHKLRGFSKNIDLMTILQKNLANPEIQTHVTRNVKLKRIFRMKLEDQERYDEFNLIKEETRIINLNFDRKRKWDRNFKDCNDVLNSQIRSNPIII